MRTLRSLAIYAVCLFVALAAAAQSSPYQPGAPLLMWKVSSKTRSAYILGSVHIADQSFYPLPAVIEDAFQSSSLLLVEVDARKIDPTQLQLIMTQLGVYPAGDDLFHHITPETRAKLTDFLSPYGMPPELFSHMKPWMLGTTITLMPLVQQGLDPNNGIDLYFLNKAGEKRVEQVETADIQFQLLSSLPDELDDAWLSEAVDQAKNAKQLWNELASDWSHGDAAKVDAFNKSTRMNDSPAEKAFERKLLEDRNPHMADRLEKCLHSTDSCFMVVGAAHLVGSEGIVDLMKARGYRVEQARVEKETTVPAPAH